VLDTQVVSAPVINQAILGGSTQQAEQLANALSGR